MRSRIVEVSSIFNNLVQNYNELEQLTKKISENGKPKAVLEIGVERGGTSYWWMSEFKAKVLGVDITDASLIRSPFTAYEQCSDTGQFDFIKANSHKIETLRLIHDYMNNNNIKYFDFLWLDGDHSYIGVKKDYEMYKHLVKNEGFIGFHDIYSDQENDGGVKKFWKELKKPYGCDIFHESIGTGLIKHFKD